MFKNLIFKTFVYIILFPSFGYIWSLVSILYLETGKYEWELDRGTFYIGATPAYIFFIASYLFGIWCIFWCRLKNHKNFFQDLVVLKIWPLVFCLLFTVIIAFNIPYELTYINKHYIDKNPMFIFKLYYWTLPYIFLYLGYVFTFFFRFKYNIKILLFLNLVGNIFIITALGNKFSLLVSIFSFFSIGYSTFILGNRRDINPSSVLKFFGLVLSISLSIYIVYRVENDPDWIINLTDRIFLLQGGMWWATYYDWFFDGSVSLSGLINYWEHYPNEKNITIGYLMQQSIGLIKTRYIIEELGYYFSGAFPAFFLLLSDNFLICIIYLLIYGSLIGLLYGEIVSSLIKGHFIAAFLLLSIFLNVYQLSENGDITFIANGMLYLKLIIFLFYKFFYLCK